MPAILPTSDEIRIFFDRDVDFQSIVGFSPVNGQVNVTTQDPFCSVPFPMAGGVAAGSNLQVAYAPPAPSVLPPNYGYIIYMPNPFNDASEVRIRFVDVTLLTPFDDPTGAISATGLPTNQNYAIPSAIWDNALSTNPNIAVPTDTSTAQNGLLELPPILPLPGSNAQLGAANITVTLFGPMNGNAVDSSAVVPANADGNAGVTDRARNQLATDITIARTLGNGPVIANNPEPPDLCLMDITATTLDGFLVGGQYPECDSGWPLCRYAVPHCGTP